MMEITEHGLRSSTDSITAYFFNVSHTNLTMISTNGVETNWETQPGIYYTFFYT